MALPTSGMMTAAMINTELGRSPTAPFSINGVAERTLAEKPSGGIAFSDFYGKANALLKTTITIGRYYSQNYKRPGSYYQGDELVRTDSSHSHGWLYGLFKLEGSGKSPTVRAWIGKTASGGSIANPFVNGRHIRSLCEEWATTIRDEGRVSPNGSHPWAGLRAGSVISFFQVYGSDGLWWNKITVGSTVTHRLSDGIYTNAGYLGREGRHWTGSDIDKRHILGQRRSGTHVLTIEE